MRQIMVRYATRPDQAEENARLIAWRPASTRGRTIRDPASESYAETAGLDITERPATLAIPE